MVFDLSQGVIFVIGSRFIQRVGRMPDPPADLVEAEIARNGEEEGGEPRRRLVAGGGLPELDKGGLRQILGFVRVGQGSVDKPDDRMLPMLHQLGEGVPITPFDAQHQQGVGILAGIGGLVGHEFRSQSKNPSDAQ